MSEITKSTRALQLADVPVTGDYRVFVEPESGEHFTIDGMTLAAIAAPTTVRALEHATGVVVDGDRSVLRDPETQEEFTVANATIVALAASILAAKKAEASANGPFNAARRTRLREASLREAAAAAATAPAAPTPDSPAR